MNTFISTLLVTILAIILPYFVFRQFKKWQRARAHGGLKDDEKKMLQLIGKNDFPQFKSLVESIQFDPNFRDPINKGTLLMMCSPPDDKKHNIAKYLIEKGVDINAVDKKGVNMLFVTTYSGSSDIFDLMLQQKDLNIDQTNNALRLELNPLSACIYKSGDLKKHIKSLNVEKSVAAGIMEKLSPNPWFVKAGKLLMKGASPALCRELIAKAPNDFKPDALQEFEKLLDLFERWHSSKKVFLTDYYLAKQGKPQHPVENKKFFALEKLPPAAIAKIANEFL